MASPAVVGRFRVQRALGSGGFATVWLAEDPELDSLVAVKVLAENWAANADVHRRFVDEARLLRRLDSDHLVRVYDIGDLEDGRPYFVMSYADGGTLADLLKERPAPWQPEDVLAVADGLAAALTVLHRGGVVHRDVKPANVLFRTALHADRHSGPFAGKQVMLGDLGIAKDLQWASGLTLPAGSPAFMAPEQRDPAGRVTPASDVHAFAMTVARLLGIQPPWPDSLLGTALSRATAEDAAERTATAAELAAELRGALARWLRAGGAPPSPTAAAALTMPIPLGTPARVDAAPLVSAAPPVDVAPTPPPTPPPAPLPTPAAAPASADPVRATPPPAPAPPAPTEPAPPAAPAPAPAAADPFAPPPSPRPASRAARARRPLHRRPLVLGGAALVLLAGGGLAARPLLTTHRLAPNDDNGVSVVIPRGWDTGHIAAASFPGADDADSGARAVGSGGRSVTVADSTSYEAPDTVLAAVPDPGCATTLRQDARVGPYDGVALTRTGCPGGVTVTDVVVGNEGTDEFTVWVQVRSVDGDPKVADVLGSLRTP